MTCVKIADFYVSLHIKNNLIDKPNYELFYSQRSFSEDDFNNEAFTNTSIILSLVFLCVGL